MGRRTARMRDPKSLTTPSSPSHSSSSSDFEFTISISPRKSTTTFCPADELFYKGQLLPLHLSQRLTMVRTLLASSSTSSSSDTNTTASRDSTGSTSSSTSSDVLWIPDCDSSRPSSVTEDDELRRLNTTTINISQAQTKKTTNKYFSLSRFFKKEGKQRECDNGLPPQSSSVKRVSDVFRKYIKKVKPLYEKLSHKQQQQQEEEKGVSACVSTTLKSALSLPMMDTNELKKVKEVRNNKERFSNSFSGNLKYPRRKRSCASSCPSSMRSSPSHAAAMGRRSGGMGCATTSSMEELQSAIQGAIAHCKKSMNGSNEI